MESIKIEEIEINEKNKKITLLGKEFTSPNFFELQYNLETFLFPFSFFSNEGEGERLLFSETLQFDPKKCLKIKLNRD